MVPWTRALSSKDSRPKSMSSVDLNKYHFVDVPEVCGCKECSCTVISPEINAIDGAATVP